MMSGRGPALPFKARRVGMAQRSHDQVLRVHVAGLFAALLAAMPLAAGGETQTPPSDKLPRFASLRSDDVNLRIGPGENYPIEWVLKRRGMPVEVVEQFENWRRIQDWLGDKGWVLDRMITDKRDVIIAGATRQLYRQPDPGSPIVARAEPGVVAQLIELQGSWCHIAAGGYKGWIARSEVWGVYPDETLQ
jgi:SH3-like domain-containing protein